MDYSLLIGLHGLTDGPVVDATDYDSDFVFYRDFNGLQASFEDNSTGPEIYYLGTGCSFHVA
jgi:hypothetical protein